LKKEKIKNETAAKPSESSSVLGSAFDSLKNLSPEERRREIGRKSRAQLYPNRIKNLKRDRDEHLQEVERIQKEILRMELQLKQDNECTGGNNADIQTTREQSPSSKTSRRK
jgi:hypothetical protein